jgi:membrane protein involved in colicin uptake
MEQWQKIGMTERSKRAALDTRLSRVEDELHALTEEQNRRTDPTASARANDVVQALIDAIAGYEAQAAKAEAAGNAAKAKTAREAAEARKVWLAEAQKGLADFKA